MDPVHQPLRQHGPLLRVPLGGRVKQLHRQPKPRQCLHRRHALPRLDPNLHHAPLLCELPQRALHIGQLYGVLRRALERDQPAEIDRPVFL